MLCRAVFACWLSVSMTAGAQSRQAMSPAVATATASVTADELARARRDGSLAANTRGTRAYFAGSVLSGATLAFVGTAVAYVVAGHAGVDLPANRRLTIADSSEAYRRAFTQAYAARMKQKRKASALAGSVAGTAIMLLVFSAPEIGRVH